MRKTSLLFIILLTVFIVLSSLIVGDKGFFGDDWPSLSFSFWYPLGQALSEYATILRRPITGLYVVPMFKITEYNPMWLFAASQGLLLVGHGLMGAALWRVFPRQRLLVITTVVMSFFMPMLLPVTYWVNSDNIRLAAIFYWLSVLGFQYWGEQPNRWSVPFFPILFFAFALLSYESVAAMPVVTALLVLPIYWQKYRAKSWGTHLWVAGQLVTAHVLSYVIFFYVRIVYQIQNPFNATESSTQFFQLIVEYVRYVALWLWHGAIYGLIHGDGISWGLGAMVAIAIGFIYMTQRETFLTDKKPSMSYLLLLALAWFGVGILPFLLFNLAPNTTTSVGGRGYALAISSVALLLAYLLQMLWNWKPIVATVIIAVWVGVFASYHVALRELYFVADDERVALLQSLADEVPNLQDNTVILLLNNPYNAEIDTITVPIMTQQLVDYWAKMFYHNRTLTTTALVDYDNGFSPIVSDEGISIPGATVPLDAVVMVERVGNQYQLVDEITDESPYFIRWQDGIDTLQTNPDRILSAPDEPTRFQRIFVYR